MPEQLLQSIGTLGRMSLEKFYSIFDAIQLRIRPDSEVNLQDIRRRSIRFLDALGHCEFDFDKRQVFARPPIFVTLPTSGLPKSVLTGTRTPRILSKLKEFEKCNSEDVSLINVQQVSHDYLIPSAIIIEAVNYQLLHDISQVAGINCNLTQPASWSLVNFSAEIYFVRDSLNFEIYRDLNWYKETFSTETLKFSKFRGRQNTSELISYINPISQQRYHLLWDGNNAAEVDRDWGRYIILANHGKNILLYDERRHVLAVPSTVPLPRILGRAAALCSGLAPEHANLAEASTKVGLPKNHFVDVYYSIPPVIARIIAKKLSQDLIRYNIVTSEKGVIK